MNRLRIARPDAGFSLTELVVTMFILSFVIITTVALTITFQRTNAQNFSRQEQIDTARYAVEAMSRSVRTAIKPAQLADECSTTCEELAAFLYGSRTAMQFVANIDNEHNNQGPSLVTYQLVTSGDDAGQIIEKVQIPDSPVPTIDGYRYCNAEATGASADCRARLSVRPVAFGVVNTADSPIFRFFDRNGTDITPAVGAQIGTDDLGRVTAVELLVTVQADNPVKAEPTTYLQRIMLPNAQAVIKMEREENP